MASFGDVFKKIAPMLTTALTFVPGGGVAAQIASAVLTKVTGSETKPDQLQDVMSTLATTEQGRIQLDAAEKEYQKAMAQMGFQNDKDLAALQASDRDSARNMEIKTGGRMPAILAVGAIVLFLVGLFLLAFVNLPAKSESAVMLLLGCEVAAFKDVYGFYFGSSMDRASSQKTQ